MDFRQLKYFITVADNRSFAKAANILYVSRPAISKSISQLENELGAVLFLRSEKGALLTPAGIKLYDKVRGHILDLEQIETDMRNSSSSYRQQIRLDLEYGLLILFEKEILNYSDHSNNLNIVYSEVSNDLSLKNLNDRRTDILIHSDLTENQSLISRPIMDSEIGLLLKQTKHLTSYGSVDTQDLRWVNLAIWNDSQLSSFCNNLNLKVFKKSNDLLRLYMLAETGKYGVILPKILLHNQFISGLQWLPIETDFRWNIYLSYPETQELNTVYKTVIDAFEKNVINPIAVRGNNEEQSNQ